VTVIDGHIIPGFDPDALDRILLARTAGAG
jgi:hypothetical protein